MALSFTRLGALLAKEVLQLRRDRPSLAMILGIPLLQLLLFGFAINMNPRDLPTVLAIADPGPMARSLVSAMANSGYFRIVATTEDPARARAMLQRGEATFVVEVPAGFTRGLVRGEQPEVQDKLRYLVEHDTLTGLFNRQYFTELLNRIHTAATTTGAIG